jgi:hypothetical protein
LAQGVPEVKKWRGGSSQQSKNIRKGILKQQASFAVLVIKQQASFAVLVRLGCFTSEKNQIHTGEALSCVKFEFFFLKLLENKAARPPTLLRDLATLTMGVAKSLGGVGGVAALFSSTA